MTTPIAMPKPGATTTEGRVVAWTVEVGARVAEGDTVVVVDSDKAEIEIAAPTAGVLRHAYVEAGTMVPCGGLLAAIADDMDDAFDAEAFHRLHHHPDVDALPLPDVPPPLPPR